MNISKILKRQIKQFKENEKLEAVESSNFGFDGYQCGYFNYDEEGDYSQQIEFVKKIVKEEKHFIKPGLSLEEYEALANRCPFEILHILKEFWMSQDGFFIQWEYTKPDIFGRRTVQYSIMPMEGAFGGKRELEECKRLYGDNQLLKRPLINYELLENEMEVYYKDPSKVDLETIMENSIILEFFSDDIFTYTLCKLDYKEVGCSQLYFVNNYSVHPLKLSLQEYFDAMLEIKGVIFGWPILFIEEENATQEVLGKKDKALEEAKVISDYLNLSIDFDKYKLFDKYIQQGFPTDEAKRLYDKGLVLYDEGNKHESLNYFRQALEYGENGLVYYQMGVIYSDLNELDKATCCIEKACLLGEDVSKIYNNLGIAQYSLGNKEEALKIFSEGAKRFPEYVGNHRLKAILLYELEQYDRVIPAYDKVIELKPTHAKYAERGLLNHNIGQYVEAVLDYTQAIERTDDRYRQSKHYLGRSSSYKRLNDIDKAFEDIEKALELDPENASICLDLIEMYITTDNCAKVFDRLTQYEKNVREKGSVSQLLLFYYLKALIYINLEVSLHDFKDDIRRLGAENLELKWYFGHTDKWIEESNMTQGQKSRVRRITEFVKGNSGELL